MSALPLYGLLDNPYLPRPLNPLRSTADGDLVARIDGCRGLDDLDNYLVTQADSRGPALVVVSGESKTGRTSVANYLVHRWAQARGHQPDRVLLINRGLGHNYSGPLALIAWVADLPDRITVDTEAVGAGNPLKLETQQRFDDLTRQKPELVATALRRLLRIAIADLASAGWALANIIEGVDTRDHVTVALDTFSLNDTILVLVVNKTQGVQESLLSDIDDILQERNARRLDLDRLDHSDIRELVRTRWEKVQPGVRNPFGRSDFEGVFQQRRRPIRDVLAILADVLASKDAAHAGAVAGWPTNTELEIGTDFMRSRVESIDMNFFGRARA